MVVNDISNEGSNGQICKIEVEEVLTQTFVIKGGHTVILLAATTFLHMVQGKEQVFTLLERDYATKDKKSFELLKGSGRDCSVSVYINENGPHSFIYSDHLKVYYFRIPPSVSPC